MIVLHYYFNTFAFLSFYSVWRPV